MERQIKTAPQQIDASEMNDLIKAGVARALVARSNATELTPEQVQGVSGGILVATSPTAKLVLKLQPAGYFPRDPIVDMAQQQQQQY